ncbi:MAG: sulfatase, partial [Planctomycetales bacterium]|nr:sulfatase [Planctomycetales bacterium]
MSLSVDITRRHFLQDCRIGLGGMALASLLAEGNGQARAAERTVGGDPLAIRPTHFPAKAKNVIFLFMAGGP